MEHPSTLVDKIRLGVFLAAALAISPSGADNWRLTSQTWQNLIGNGATFSPFDYDAQGHRVQRRDFNGQDSLGAMVSHTVWEYDASDRPSREITFNGSDTVSILVRDYNLQGHEIQESVFGVGGKLRYRDSMSVDGQGNLTVSVRTAGTGSILSRKTFFLDGLQNQELDTTWQPLVGGGFEAVLATQTQSTSGRVAWIQQWSKALGGTQWNPTRYTEMAYSGSLLASVSNLEGDGSGRVLVDSTCFASDADGNRLSERTFNQDRVASTLIQYSWVKIITTAMRVREAKADGISVIGNRLRVSAIAKASEVSLLDAKGRMVVRWTNAGSTEFDIPSSLPKGTYFAVAKGGGAPLVCAITLAR